MKLGTNIFTLRTQKGLSQGDLADALQVSRQSISKWETGGATPDLDKLLALCDLFGVTLDELVRSEIVEASPAETAAADAANVPAGKATPAPEDNPSMLRTVLICILVVLGILMLPSIFMSPGAWPGILLLLVIGGFGFALWTRSREDAASSEAEQKRSAFRTQFLKIALLSAVILLPVIGLANSLPAGPVYAKAGKESTLTPQDYPGVRFATCSGGQTSVSYSIINETDEIISYNASEQRIEVLKGGKWYTLKKRTEPDRAHAGQLQSGKGMYIQISCEELYGNLGPGDYRVMVQIYPLSESRKAQWIAREFTIQAAFQLP